MGKTALPPCLILFDGVCSFCNGFVRWLIPRDPERLCYFVPSQSDAGREVMARCGISQNAVEETIHVIAEGKVVSRSDAVLSILARLSFPWHVGAWGRWLPGALRDGAYRVFSANRYRWFGKHDECPIPTADERRRFLQETEEVARFIKKGSPEPTPGQNP